MLTSAISLRPVAFFDELAANASVRGVKVVIYAGNDDTVVPHFSSESKFISLLHPNEIFI